MIINQVQLGFSCGKLNAIFNPNFETVHLSLVKEYYLWDYLNLIITAEDDSKRGWNARFIIMYPINY